MSKSKAKKVACGRCGKKITAGQLGNHVKWNHTKKSVTKSPRRNGQGSLLTKLQSTRKKLVDKLGAVDEAIVMVKDILE